jgi:hypothetical protein
MQSLATHGTHWTPRADPGTFLVELTSTPQHRRLRSANALNVGIGAGVLQRIYGLDINPFSVVLSQIQMLWQLLGRVRVSDLKSSGPPPKALIPHIMIEGGRTSLDTFDQPMELQTHPRA